MSLNNEIVWTSIPSADFNVTGRRLMGIRSGYAIIRIDREELEFQFEGNLLSKVAGVFQYSALPIVMGNVEEALANTINDQLPISVNALFQNDDGYLKLFPSSQPKFEDFRIDFSINKAPNVTEDFIGFSSKALWFNSIQGYREIPNRGDPLPMWRYDKPHELQIMANKYFWDGFCRTFVESNPGWGFNLTQENLGSKSPI